MDNQRGFNTRWGIEEHIEFNRILIDEKEVFCAWTENGTSCNKLVKGKDFKPHLRHIHGITSDLLLYQCRWHACSTDPMKRSSLERHVEEQHIPAKWACADCALTFTREATLINHIQRTPGHRQLSAT